MSTSKDLKRPTEALTEFEKQALAELWDTGKLKTISDHLLEFVDRHCDDIREMAPGEPSPEVWVEAVKRLVRKRGSIHLPSDMADQIREINNEIWYRGEKGDYNSTKIKEEWALRYAHKWREWRVKEILYVIDRRQDEVAATLPR